MSSFSMRKNSLNPDMPQDILTVFATQRQVVLQGQPPVVASRQAAFSCKGIGGTSGQPLHLIFGLCSGSLQASSKIICLPLPYGPMAT